jgi:hypothetical protein
MKCVYLFDNKEATVQYMKEFGYKRVLLVTYKPEDVAGTWKPAYANHTKVIRLKPGKTAWAFDE